MKTVKQLSHFRRVDYREESLNQILKGLDQALKVLERRTKEVEWYDELWYMEDSEPIYGLTFIAFQNYIVGSINDLYGTTETKIGLYKLEPNLNSFENSSIQLIIALANYCKHKDEGELHKSTKMILESFGLNDFTEITNSPIFNGLLLLDNDWDLFKIFNIVLGWRKKLFDDYIESQYQSL